MLPPITPVATVNVSPTAYPDPIVATVTTVTALPATVTLITPPVPLPLVVNVALLYVPFVASDELVVIDPVKVTRLALEISNYAIDYNKDNYIDLKNNEDAYPSAANYLKKMGWKREEPCFYRIELKNNVPNKLLNVSAKKIHSKKKFIFFKKYIENKANFDFLDDDLITAVITPDKDIIPNAETLTPAYIVFDNYEIILKWNRSLRFSLAVCTLKDKFKDEL